LARRRPGRRACRRHSMPLPTMQAPGPAAFRGQSWRGPSAIDVFFAFLRHLPPPRQGNRERLSLPPFTPMWRSALPL
jgi:hypothetical protein